MVAAISAVASILPLRAEVVSINIPPPPAPESGYFKLGSTKNPAGHEISVNSRSLLFDGQPVFPVMGEFHCSRTPATEWREELRKMKAGGVDIVATYAFWIHHEEIQGLWDWSGQRDFRKFIQICGELGLKVKADGLQPGDLSRQMEFGDFPLHLGGEPSEHQLFWNSRHEFRSHRLDHAPQNCLFDAGHARSRHPHRFGRTDIG